MIICTCFGTAMLGWMGCLPHHRRARAFLPTPWSSISLSYTLLRIFCLYHTHSLLSGWETPHNRRIATTVIVRIMFLLTNLLSGIAWRWWNWPYGCRHQKFLSSRQKFLDASAAVHNSSGRVRLFFLVSSYYKTARQLGMQAEICGNNCRPTAYKFRTDWLFGLFSSCACCSSVAWLLIYYNSRAGASASSGLIGNGENEKIK